MTRMSQRRSLPAVLALIGALVLATGAVMAAAPPGAPLPRASDDPAPVSRALKLVGWAAAVNRPGLADTRLRVVTVNGTFDVAVTESTKILRASDGKPLPSADLDVALPLDVQGEVTDDAQLRATVVTVGQLPPTLALEALTVRGRLLAAFDKAKATADRRLLVVTGGRGDAVVEVDQATVILTSNGDRLAFADLKPGLAVTVQALGTTQAVVRAESVEVSVNGRAPQVNVDGVLRARGSLALLGERWIVGEVLVRVPADLARAQAAVVAGTQVSVTARRADDGELEAVKVRAVTKAGPAQMVDVQGFVERLDAASLVVDGVTVALTAQTAAPPSLAVGMYVKVRARLDADGRFTAERVQVRATSTVEVQFEGAIDVLGMSEWRVAGVTVRITKDTVVTGDVPQVGSHAKVTGYQARDGAVEASRISASASVTPASWSAVEGVLTAVTPPPGIWQVLARDKTETDVVVTESTVIDESGGGVRVGAWVSVRGQRDADNRLEARRILVRSSVK
jgi:hypothetical protein